MKHLFPSLFRTCSDLEFKCETCVMTKSHRASFPISESKATLPFDLIHSDVWVQRRLLLMDSVSLLLLLMIVLD